LSNIPDYGRLASENGTVRADVLPGAANGKNSVRQGGKFVRAHIRRAAHCLALELCVIELSYGRIHVRCGFKFDQAVVSISVSSLVSKYKAPLPLATFSVSANFRVDYIESGCASEIFQVLGRYLETNQPESGAARRLTCQLVSTGRPEICIR